MSLATYPYVHGRRHLRGALFAAYNLEEALHSMSPRRSAHPGLGDSFAHIRTGPWPRFSLGTVADNDRECPQCGET